MTVLLQLDKLKGRADAFESTRFENSRVGLVEVLLGLGVARNGTRLAGPVEAELSPRHGGDGRSDGPVVSDGPYAETVEQLSGFYLVDLPDLDAAIAVARLLPPAYTLEIRPAIHVEGWEPP